MSTTTNAILLDVAGHRVALDLDTDASASLLLSYQANDRLDPSTIQSTFSAEVSLPATAKNHRLLAHAAASQPAKGSAYVRLPCVVTSGGVESLPIGLLYVKGFSEGRYQVLVLGGNKRLVEAIGDKKLSDLDFSRFNHNWTPANILTGLPYAHWQQMGWGYELFDRGRPIEMQAVDPYTLYPSCRAELVLQQIFTDAGFTTTSLVGEPLFAQLNVPSANPYTFSQEYRDARSLKAGFEHTGNWYRDDEFQEVAPFNFTSRKPYAIGAVAQAGGTTANHFVAPVLGYYDLNVSLPVYFGCNPNTSGEVSMKALLRKNGVPLLNDDGTEVKAEDRFNGYKSLTFTLTKKVLLQPGDVIDVRVQGDKWPGNLGGPNNGQWYIGTRVVRIPGINLPPDFSGVEPATNWSAELNPEFPPGGLVKLNEWLPEMKQLNYLKAYLALGSLTCQVDAYTSQVQLMPGYQLVAGASRALDWSIKLDRYSQLGRLPERSLEYRLENYAQTNWLKWREDENVTADYGNGSLLVADEVLPAEAELFTLPFAATEVSKQVPGLLSILNFEVQDAAAKPVTYSRIEAQPRLVLRADAPDLTGQLVLVPEHLDGNGNIVPAVLAPFTTTASYFDSPDLSLVLDRTVKQIYYTDLRAMLDETRVLTENLRLTAADITALDFTRCLWFDAFQDYFCLASVGEFSPGTPTACKLIRLNAAHLGPPPVPPVVPSGLREWWGKEWYASEWY